MSTDMPVTAGSEAVFFSVLMLYMEYGNIATVHFVHSNVLRDAQKNEPSCDKHKK